MPLPPNKPNPLDGSDYPLSPELEKERRKTEIPVSGKRMGIRIAAFVVVLGIAVTFISLGIAGVFNASSGVQEIKVNSDKEEGTRYGNGFRFYYNISGSFFETNGKLNEVRSVYTEAMKDSYRLFDAYRDYPDIMSVHALSLQPDQEVTLDARLYGALKDIYDDASLRPYLFMAPLYEVWETLMASPAAAVARFDPVNHEGNKNFIASYLPMLNREDSFSLTFLADNKVVYHLPEDYSTWATQYEYDGPSLWLGPLEDVYRMSIVRDAFVAMGLTDGVLLSEEGSTMSMGGLNDNAGNLLCYDGNCVRNVGAVSFGGNKSIIDLHLCPLESANDGQSYVLENSQGQKIIRNLIISPTTGYPVTGFASLRYEGEASHLPVVKKAALSAAINGTEESVKSSLYSGIYSRPSESLILHVPSSMKERIILAKEYQITIQTY